MFYERYRSLCKEEGKSPTAVALELGISISSVSTWKNLNRIPKMDVLQRIAEHFHVTVDYLVGNVNEPWFRLDNQKILDEINDPGPKEKPGTYGHSAGHPGRFSPDDELMAFYNNVKDHLTEVDLADIRALMKIRAELNLHNKDRDDQ